MYLTAFENDDIPPKGFSLENVHLRKSWHGTANIEVPRPTYLEVLCTAKNLGTACTEPAPFTLSEFAVPCQKKAAPVPKNPGFEQRNLKQ